MEAIEQLLVNNVSAIVTAGGFILYLLRRDKIEQKKDEGHNEIVKNHLHESNTVIKDNSEAQKTLAVELKGLSSIIKANGKKNDT